MGSTTRISKDIDLHYSRTTGKWVLDNVRDDKLSQEFETEFEALEALRLGKVDWE